MHCRPTGPKSKLSNGRTVTNLASYNFYNLVANETLKEKAIQTLRTYGVGPCGPPGFYGTQDVHMKTEADIASHLGVPACILYAQAFSTISSVIPAFSKRGDIIVADKAVNYSIRKGLQISRSSVRWYEHNDMEDLQRVLEKVIKEQAKKPLTRRFIITEGIFENIGDTVDLPRIVRISFRIPNIDANVTAIDRTQASLQIPSHPRRDLVLWGFGSDGEGSNRTAERRFAGHRYDRWFPGRSAMCRWWLLRWVGRDCGASAYISCRLHLLGCFAGHARHYRQ